MCLQGSEVRVNFVVMRPAETQEEGGSGREGQHNRAGRRPEPQFFRRRSTYTKVLVFLFIFNHRQLFCAGIVSSIFLLSHKLSFCSFSLVAVASLCVCFLGVKKKISLS